MKLKASAEVYPKRLDHVVWKVIDGKGILLNLETGAYYETDPVGLVIWQKCDGKTSSEAIVRSIAETFKTEAGRVRRDQLVFVKELKRRRLLEISGKPTSRA